MYIISQRLLLKFIYFFITTQLYFIQKSHGNQINCTPSSCGEIRNISYPFRLNTDPKRCGHPKYELSCENNTTSLYLNSQKYLVQSINYANYTIRITDASVVENDTCSFPNYSLSGSNFSARDSYGIKKYSGPWYIYGRKIPDITSAITFMSCPNGTVNTISNNINNSSLVLYQIDEYGRNCGDGRFKGRSTYVKFGAWNGSFLMDSCRVDLMVMTSLNMKRSTLSSLSQVHSCLTYGFELTWFSVLCGDDCLNCWFNGDRATCSEENWIFRLRVPIQIFSIFLTYLFLPNLALKIVVGMPCVFVLLIYTFRRRHLSVFDAIECFLRSNNNLKTIRYSYSDMKKITKGFREKLGQGGYGSVYKGKLRSGHDVAVKVLAKPSSNGQDFINEVATIGRIHHVNVVKLVGYCAERSKRALVYDFMPNGSLEKYIFNKEKSHSLNLKRKYEIAIGVARGIEYLHRGCDIQILHFDIKPHNILLDENFTPKISDFGLAKFYSTDNTTVTLTAVRGTIGYVAPELMNRSIGGVSYKADVYSFGMLLMEMLGLNKGTGPNIENKSSQYFPCWIYDHLNKGEDIEIGNVYENNDDEEKEDDDDARKMRRKMTIVGLWCIQMSPADRPSMSEVLKMLEGEDENMMIPPQHSQSSEIPSYDDQTWGTESESTGSVAFLRNDSLSFQ
ncbi:PREDICTED: probable receptor-like protein kinase At1g67000 [Erythranthe guttata]|nr:PREDICTED: probable receptor-like protein kinase At1g67000 [Erythranthe guttata]|eukprot:XP_012851378.1 PREDICTED: probable receptor-like protein kinase At1g67000 [Erythranthe guttata]